MSLLESDWPIHSRDQQTLFQLYGRTIFMVDLLKMLDVKISDPAVSAPCRPLFSAGLPFVSMPSAGTYQMSRKERNVEFVRMPPEIPERGTDGGSGGGEQPAGRRCHRLISRH